MAVGEVIGPMLGGAVISYAFQQLADAGLGKTIRQRLQTKFVEDALNRAISSALEAFEQEFPDLARNFFDENFLSNRAAPEIAKLLSRHGSPDETVLANLYQNYFSNEVEGLVTACARFIALLDEAMQSESILWDLLDTRDIRQLKISFQEFIQNQKEESLKTSDIVEEIIDRFIKKSAPLLRYQQVLKSGEWIEGDEFEQILQTISNNDSGLTILLGVPGQGKSALLSRLANELQESGKAILALKADRMPRGTETPIDLQEWIGAPCFVVSVRSGRGMGPVKRISHVEARPHKVLSFCW